MLDYENEAFLEIVGEDGLLIMAKGLGLERLFVNLLKIYSDPTCLVLVIGTTNDEEEYFLSQLENAKEVSQKPKVITAECGTTDRQGIYLQGGILFVTSRILVVDLLTQRVPIDLITGILVYRAHKVIENAQEAFILRLFREKNKTGFIKAFSDSPNSFTVNFCHVERTMRHLFVRKLYLWPRFHATVNNTLEKKQPRCFEIDVKLSPSAVSIQTSLLSLISICLKELKGCNPNLDTDELTVENIVSKSFEKVIRYQLKPHWNELSSKTKQLVADLRSLANMLMCLIQSDSVSFYNLIHSLRASEKAFQESNWLFLDSAQSLYVRAKERVFGTENAGKEEMKLEENPKWSVLTEILKEIETEQKNIVGRGNVLILAQDQMTCNQIREYLCHGSRVILTKLFNKSAAVRNSNFKIEEAKGKVKVEDDEQTLTQMLKDKENSIEKVEYSFTEDGILTHLPTFIEPYKVYGQQNHVARVLDVLEPQYVVMYDPNLPCVRQLEVYQANRSSVTLTVYFLTFGGSVEEQRYLTTIRKEKDAFAFLIKEKATMVIPEEREGKTDGDHPDLIRDPRRANQTVNAENTRKGGIQSTEIEVDKRRVLVDMREFNSDLPSLIHRRGMNIVPLTLQVGDYILTPDICIERKSLSDLIGSLNSGRLYNQATAMSRSYKTPMLLIEFDHNKAFGMHAKGYMSHDMSAQDISSKLAVLTLHFPQLRLLWCASSYAAAELFDELKVGKPEPDEQKAATVTTTETASADRYHPAPLDFLMKLPGVNFKNCYALMNESGSISELTEMSVEQISNTIENCAKARDLWESLHLPIDKLKSSSTNAVTKQKGCSRWKRKK